MITNYDECGRLAEAALPIHAKAESLLLDMQKLGAAIGLESRLLGDRCEAIAAALRHAVDLADEAMRMSLDCYNRVRFGTSEEVAA